MNNYKYFIGDDGKSYYTYAVGAVYEFTPTTEAPFTYTITACRYEKSRELKRESGTEYYTLVAADGRILSEKYSAEQVDFLLHCLPCRQIAEGVREELPLLVEEVRLYYNDRAKELSKANAEANNTLKGTEYFKNKSAIERLEGRLLFAKTDGDCARVDELTKRIEEYKAKQAEILRANNIDEAILTKRTSCEICGDTGLIHFGDKICKCAYKNTAKIKSYCAAIRLRGRLK